MLEARRNNEEDFLLAANKIKDELDKLSSSNGWISEDLSSLSFGGYMWGYTRECGKKSFYISVCKRGTGQQISFSSINLNGKKIEMDHGKLKEVLLMDKIEITG